MPHPGANDIDEHFRTAPFEQNIPVLLGLASVWNVSFLGYPARAILPYCQALSKLAPHIQQVRHLLIPTLGSGGTVTRVAAQSSRGPTDACVHARSVRVAPWMLRQWRAARAIE